MRRILICAASLALSSGAALADDVTIHHDKLPAPGVVIEHRAADVEAHKKVITHEENGCTTKTVKKTNGEGDTMTKSKSNC